MRLTAVGRAAEGIPRKLARTASGVWRTGSSAVTLRALPRRIGVSLPSRRARSSSAEPQRRARSFSVARATKSTSRGQAASSGATDERLGTRSKAWAATSARRSEVSKG